MFIERNMLADAFFDTDVEQRIDSILNNLAGSDLAGRIQEAARMAVARHMFLQAQDPQIAVEAENSAQ